MSEHIDRRDFIFQGGSAALGASALAGLAPLPPSMTRRDSPVVAVMGVNSRGNEDAKAFVRAGADVAYICDVDSRAVEKTVATSGKAVTFSGKRYCCLTICRCARKDRPKRGLDQG